MIPCKFSGIYSSWMVLEPRNVFMFKHLLLNCLYISGTNICLIINISTIYNDCTNIWYKLLAVPHIKDGHSPINSVCIPCIELDVLGVWTRSLSLSVLVSVVYMRYVFYLFFMCIYIYCTVCIYILYILRMWYVWIYLNILYSKYTLDICRYMIESNIIFKTIYTFGYIGISLQFSFVLFVYHLCLHLHAWYMNDNTYLYIYI
jgi:hypothetical protein